MSEFVTNYDRAEASIRALAGHYGDVKLAVAVSIGKGAISALLAIADALKDIGVKGVAKR